MAILPVFRSLDIMTKYMNKLNPDGFLSRHQIAVMEGLNEVMVKLGLITSQYEFSVIYSAIVRTLYNDNSKIVAIKKLRTMLEVSRYHTIQYISSNNCITQYFDNTNKIDFSYVETCGLKEAKDIVDWIIENEPSLNEKLD